MVRWEDFPPELLDYERSRWERPEDLELPDEEERERAAYDRYSEAQFEWCAERGIDELDAFRARYPRQRAKFPDGIQPRPVRPGPTKGPSQ